MFRVTICDDEITISLQLKVMIEKKYDKSLQVECVDDLQEYLQKLKEDRKNIPDIIIMDIRWKEADEKNREGINGAAELQKLFPRLKVIFLTGYISYAPDIFDARPSAFLTKPIEEQRLFQTLNKIIDEIEAEKRTALSIQNGGEVINIYPQEIIYIESNKHELILHLTQETKRIWAKLDEIMEKLPICFIRIHQSFAVNASFIRKFGSSKVELINEMEVPISRSRYKKAKESFLDYLEN